MQMLALLIVAALFGFTAAAAADGSTATGSEGESVERVLAPEHRRVIFDSSAFDRVSAKWDKGYLITRKVEHTGPASKAVFLYDATGAKVGEASFWPEGATRVLIRNAAVTPDGKIVMAAGVDKADGTSASFLVLSDASGKILSTIPTSPYIAGSVCVTPQGAVWTFGWSGWERPEAAMLRRFDFVRGEVAAHLPLSIFEGAERNPAASLRPGALLTFTCAADRLAVYSESGGEFIEMDYATGTARRWKIGDSGDGLTLALPLMAVTSSGDVFAIRGSAVFIKEGELRGLFYLERDEGSGTVRWRPVQGQVSRTREPGAVFAVLGADGDDIVCTSNGDPAVKWTRVLTQE